MSEQPDVEWQKSVQGFQDEETEVLLLEDESLEYPLGQPKFVLVEDEHLVMCEDVGLLGDFYEGDAVDVVVDKDVQELDHHRRSDDGVLSAGHSCKSLVAGGESL